MSVKDQEQSLRSPENDPSKRKRYSFGGYAARESYERKREERKKVRSALATVGIVVLFLAVSALAVFGVVALARGDFSVSNDSDGVNHNGSITVPNQSQLNQRDRGIAEMLEDLSRSQCVVEVTLSDGTVRKGSGFVISDDGYAVCSAGLFSLEEETETTEDEPEEPEERTVTSIVTYTEESTYDVAILVDKEDSLGLALVLMENKIKYSSVSNNTSAVLSRGEEVYVVGSTYQKEYQGTIVSGVASFVNATAKTDDEREVSVFYIDCVPNESLFGAPVMNSQGNVVGFCTDAVDCPWSNMTAAIPISFVYAFVNEMLA